jgi:hypothetical protein
LIATVALMVGLAHRHPGSSADLRRPQSGSLVVALFSNRSLLMKIVFLGLSVVSASLASAAPAAAEPAAPGAGALGLRVHLLGGGLPPYSPVKGAVANAPSPVGAVGGSYALSDRFTLTGELGAQAVLAGGTPRYGARLSVGVERWLWTTADALRPFLHASLAIGRAPQNDLTNTGQDLPELAVELGGGAAYFWSRHFSLSCRVGIGGAVRFGLGAPAKGGGLLTFGTVTPSVGASWFF